MSSALRLRRDPTSLIAVATGLQGEVFFDTAKNTLVCQDGATVGGFPLAKISDLPAINSFRNRFINGNFSINQLVVTGSVVLAAGVYGHDGWKAGAAGCSYTFAVVGLDTTITITVGSLIQVGDAKKIEGGAYSLSNAGTAQARIAINGGTPTGAYAACPLTTGAATAAQSVTAEFTTGTLSRVQLEPGANPSAFERLSPTANLRECQAYFEKSYSQGVAPGAITSSGVAECAVFTPFILYAPSVTFKVTKASVPTITIWNPTHATSSGSFEEFDTGGTDLGPVPAGVSRASDSNFSVAPSAGTANAGTTVLWHWTSSARL